MLDEVLHTWHMAFVVPLSCNCIFSFCFENLSCFTPCNGWFHLLCLCVLCVCFFVGIYFQLFLEVIALPACFGHFTCMSWLDMAIFFYTIDGSDSILLFCIIYIHIQQIFNIYSILWIYVLILGSSGALTHVQLHI